ncbi:MAG: hypothetical protein JWL69_2433 [Phycisphaerales bacterium]|nr:hypothetical protein [Phycisphaerales bacterium]
MRGEGSDKILAAIDTMPSCEAGVRAYDRGGKTQKWCILVQNGASHGTTGTVEAGRRLALLLFVHKLHLPAFHFFRRHVFDERGDPPLFPGGVGDAGHAVAVELIFGLGERDAPGGQLTIRRQQTTTRMEVKRPKYPGRSSAWQSVWFGTRRPQVQILSPRFVFNPLELSGRDQIGAIDSRDFNPDHAA